MKHLIPMLALVSFLATGCHWRPQTKTSVTKPTPEVEAALDDEYDCDPQTGEYDPFWDRSRSQFRKRR